MRAKCNIYNNKRVVSNEGDIGEFVGEGECIGESFTNLNNKRKRKSNENDE